MRVSLPVRTYPLNPSFPYDESDRRAVEVTLDYDLDRAALVLVDVWDRHHIASHWERVRRIVEQNLGPAVEACRRAGVLIVHGPTARVAAKYETYRFDPDARSIDFGEGPDPELGRAFSETFDRLLPEAKGRPLPDFGISPRVGPLPGDCVIANGEELHLLLKAKKRFHLLYAGFCTNGCLQLRDYGIHLMRRRGYNVVLLRDCTTGIEYAESRGALLQTTTAVRDIEMIWGVSTTSGTLLEALRGRDGSSRST